MKWDVDKTTGVMWIAPEAAKSLTGSMQEELGIRSQSTSLIAVITYLNGVRLKKRTSR